MFIWVVNTDAVSYMTKMPHKILALADQQKKCKYLDACLGQPRQFTPFFVSVDGLLGTKAEAKLKGLDSRLATKWQQT